MESRAAATRPPGSYHSHEPVGHKIVTVPWPSSGGIAAYAVNFTARTDPATGLVGPGNTFAQDEHHGLNVRFYAQGERLAGRPHAPRPPAGALSAGISLFSVALSVKTGKMLCAVGNNYAVMTAPCNFYTVLSDCPLPSVAFGEAKRGGAGTVNSAVRLLRWRKMFLKNNL